MISPNPLVSIWIPVYNGAHLISKALESCIHQTYRNIEIVVFDDASSDDTDEVVAAYVQKDKRIKYHKTPARLGQNRSYVKILELCSEELTHMLCCDDWLSRNYMEEVVGLFAKYPSAGAVTGRAFNIREENGHFFFTRESDVKKKKSGVYDRRYFGKYTYRSFLTSLIILGTVRRKDALRAMHRVNELMDNPPSELDDELKAMMRYEYGGEDVFCAEVMANYDILYISEKAILLKTELPIEHYMSNKGSMKLRKEFGLLDNTAKAVFKYYYLKRKMCDIAFKKDWRDFIPAKRFFFGKEAITAVLFGVLKNRFSISYFKGFRCKDIKQLFSGYSLYEVTSVMFFAIPFILMRIVFMLKRRIVKAPEQNIYQSIYFLNQEKRFTTVQ